MVKVRFLNLLRSKYQIELMSLKKGTIHEIIDQVLLLYPHVEREDLENATIFVNQEKVMHYQRFNTKLEDGDQVVFTHFVGGG